MSTLWQVIHPHSAEDLDLICHLTDSHQLFSFHARARPFDLSFFSIFRYSLLHRLFQCRNKINKIQFAQPAWLIISHRQPSNPSCTTTTTTTTIQVSRPPNIKKCKSPNPRPSHPNILKRHTSSAHTHTHTHTHTGGCLTHLPSFLRQAAIKPAWIIGSGHLAFCPIAWRRKCWACQGKAGKRGIHSIISRTNK